MTLKLNNLGSDPLQDSDVIEVERKGVKALSFLQKIKNYISAINLLDGVTSTLQSLKDSNGNTLPIKISSTGVFSNPEVFAATAGGSGATQAIDLSKGNICTVSLVNSKANAITISNVTKGVYIIILKQDGTGSCTISSWNGGTAVVWAGGSAPTLTTTASYVDIVTLLYDGTTLRGTSTLNFAS